MENIIKLTRELGAAIQESDAFKNYTAAKKANDDSAELQKMIGEFNLIRMRMDEALSAENKDEEALKADNEKMRSLYAKIMQSKEMTDYNEAKTVLDDVVKQVYGLLELILNGEDPQTAHYEEHNCGGNCSGCSGCH